MGRILDLIGTSVTKFQIGLLGPFLKNNSGAVDVRNAADSAWVLLRALNIAVTGDSLTLNEQATSSGASWKFTLSRPSAGMTHDLTVIMPSGDPSVGQALTVASFASNIITLQWSAAASTSALVAVDTTNLAFGTSSPLTMYTAPANAIHTEFEVIIDTPFNGTPSLSIGITGTTSKYMGTGQVDLTAAAGISFGVQPNLAAPGSTENIIATYSAGGATAGAARILGFYCIPS
jgi:hypothetical protein